MALQILPFLMLSLPGSAQETRSITLAEAVSEARERSPEVAIAEARARGAGERVGAVRASLWPTLGVEAGVTSSTDPVAAFGGRLRQGRFTEADFDTDRLNHPNAFTDWDGAVVMGWTPVDFSRDAAVGAARAGARAARFGAEWAVRLAEYQVEVRYVEAAGAEWLLRAAELAAQAAEADFDRAERRLGEGIGTDADVLQASAALEGARARVISAERSVQDARARLGHELGWPADTVPVPATSADMLTEAAATPERSGSGRPDLAASQAQVEAASASADQTARSRLPRLEAFARAEAHTADGFDPGGDSWSVGLRVRVPIFSGFGIGSETRSRRAEAEARAIEHERAVARARVEVGEVRRAVDASRRAALAAEAGFEAATEAARLVRRRYEEGMATTAELLAAQAAAVRHEAEHIRARLEHRVAVAGLVLLDDPILDMDPAEGVDR